MIAMLGSAAYLPVSSAPMEVAPVHWRVRSVPRPDLRGGQIFRVVLSGTIAPGWHIYTLSQPEGGPTETSVGLRGGDPAVLLHVEGGRPVSMVDPTFGERTEVFRGHADFTLQLRLQQPTVGEGQPLHILVRYQACSEHVCLAPRTDAVDCSLRSRP